MATQVTTATTPNRMPARQRLKKLCGSSGIWEYINPAPIHSGSNQLRTQRRTRVAPASLLLADADGGEARRELRARLGAVGLDAGHREMQIDPGASLDPVRAHIGVGEARPDRQGHVVCDRLPAAGLGEGD